MTQDQLPPQDAQPAPAMELLDGDATQAPAAGSSRLVKVARGAMYGTVMLAAVALLAVNAVPELANYASFVPEKDRGGACHAAMAGGSHCTTLDNVSFDSPCCASKAMARFNCQQIQSGGCCPASGESAADEALVATTAASCCAASGCPLGDAVAEDDQPIDAGSLLASADEPADEQPGEEGNELTPDDNDVEE